MKRIAYLIIFCFFCSLINVNAQIRDELQIRKQLMNIRDLTQRGNPLDNAFKIPSGVLFFLYPDENIKFINYKGGLQSVTDGKRLIIQQQSDKFEILYVDFSKTLFQINIVEGLKWDVADLCLYLDSQDIPGKFEHYGYIRYLQWHYNGIKMLEINSEGAKETTDQQEINPVLNNVCSIIDKFF